MISIKQRFSYLYRSLINFKQIKKCPYCGNLNFNQISSKFFLTKLLKCKECHLFHRHPKDDEKWLENFYQSEYNLHENIITSLPSDLEIENLKRSNFSTLKNHDTYIKQLFNKPINIIDYGCSWGYNVFKLIQSGHKAIGYELSIPRAKFGETKLKVPIYSDVNLLPKNTDLIISSHVIEHLANINDFVLFSKNHLNKNGVFMAFCPNGSIEYKNREPDIWDLNWGAVHPNFLNIDFAKYVFQNNPYLILTGDWNFNIEDISQWDGMSQIVGKKLDGKELLIISKPNICINQIPN